MLREEYGDQIVFCRIDELVAAVKEYNSTYELVEGKLRLLLVILAAAIIALIIFFHFKFRKA